MYEHGMNTLATATDRRPQYFNLKINWLKSLLSVLLGFPPASPATYSNCGSSWLQASWQTTAQDIFIAPEDFNTLPIGEPVSLVRWAGVGFNCSITNTTPQYGIGMAAVPGTMNATG